MSPLALVTPMNTPTSPAGPAPDDDMYSGLKAFSESYTLVHGYIVVVVCAWGTAANVANIVVLTRRKMRSSTNLILSWLAVADLLTMVSCLPVSVHFNILRDPRLYFPCTLSQGWIAYFIFHINFTVACHTVAIWLTITLAIFRYLCICYPTRGAAWCSVREARTAIFAVYACTAVVCIPNYMASHPVAKTLNGTENTSYLVYYTVEDTTNTHLQSANYWIQAFLIKLIPCLLLTLLTVLLVLAMHAANVRRMTLKSQGRQDESERARETNRTTAMLLAVVGLFLLTELPQGVLTLCSLFVKRFYEDVYCQLGDILDIMALLNNSINFVLYCSMSRQFRETFVETFCACCPKQAPGWFKLVPVKGRGAGQPLLTGAAPPAEGGTLVGLQPL